MFGPQVCLLADLAVQSPADPEQQQSTNEQKPRNIQQTRCDHSKQYAQDGSDDHAVHDRTGPQFR